MRFIILILCSISLIVVSVWAYNVNYKARSTIKALNYLSSEIEKKESQIKLLKAEWAYLNRPERLNRLITIHFSELGLIPLSHENYVSFENFISSNKKRSRVVSGTLGVEDTFKWSIEGNE